MKEAIRERDASRQSTADAEKQVCMGLISEMVTLPSQLEAMKPKLAEAKAAQSQAEEEKQELSDLVGS